MNSGVDDDTLPPRAQAGVCLHITSLPGPYGIGEIGQHARAFVDAMRSMQLGVWQFLPTGPTAYGDSPYQALSTFAGNELLIDVQELVERGLLRAGEAAALTPVSNERVDYGALIPVKLRLLFLAAERFSRRADRELNDGYTDFLDANNSAWLHDYALFRILKAQHGERPWPEWQPAYAHRETRALRRLESTAAEQIEKIRIVQYLFSDQWRRLQDHANAAGIRLFGDLPIYIALDSADAWANPDILQLDRSGKPQRLAGVPPDYFSKDGQLWGTPLYAWNAHAANGYRWWAARLGAAMRQADLVRIDHFRGFESYWSIPADAAIARDGRWEPGPGDALFDALRTELGALPVVAEDLGEITPAVDALRERHGLPGMHVLQFDVMDPDFDLSCIPEHSVCYTGTHDNDTTRGWFFGGPNDRRPTAEIRQTQAAALAFTRGRPRTIHLDMIRAACSSAARIAIAPLQDFLGLDSAARLNTPGTITGNWRWRVRGEQLDREFCDNVAEIVTESNRGNISRT